MLFEENEAGLRQLMLCEVRGHFVQTVMVFIASASLIGRFGNIVNINIHLISIFELQALIMSPSLYILQCINHRR